MLYRHIFSTKTEPKFYRTDTGNMPKRRPLCPLCVSNKVVPILYGMPTHGAWEEANRGKFEIGGCCVSDGSPKWHCQACDHEFGKYLPSGEDLENPEPDGIKPLKLEFFIGGYSGPNHGVRLENGLLKYKLFESHPDYPEKEASVVPTNRKWLNFRKKLDVLDVWNWKSDYPNPGVCDGTQWEFEVDYGVKKIKSSGDNAYPGAEQIGIIDDMTVTKDDANEFDAFLRALSLLLGGVKIG